MVTFCAFCGTHASLGSSRSTIVYVVPAVRSLIVADLVVSPAAKERTRVSTMVPVAPPVLTSNVNEAVSLPERTLGIVLSMVS
jgi:hypothetical protein